MAKTPGKTPRKPTGKPAAKPAAEKPKAAPKPVASNANKTTVPAAGKSKTAEANVETAKTPPAPAPDNSEAVAAPIRPQPSVVTNPVEPPRRSGVLMPLLGGVLAAAIGAAAVLYLLPQGWDNNSDELNNQAARVTALQGGLDALRAEIPGDRSATIAALQDEVAAFAATVAELDGRVATATTDLSDRTDTLTENLARVQDTQDTLTGRVGALEARPVDQAPDIAALQADVRALTERLETAAQEARDQILAANDRAAEVEQLAVAGVANQATQSALNALSDAIASGRSFADALGAFQSAAPDAEIASVLSENATDGVASLRMLRADFPGAARAALASAVTATPEDATMMDRMAALFNSQTGARSLSPREGDDADAVLSRAEAALGEGDLAETVRELAALPPEAAAPMQDWLTRARTRLDVVSALNDLSAPKTSN